MSIKFTDICLQADSSTTQFQWVEGKIINVKNYLSTELKNNIIQLTLQNSREESGLYNPILVEMYFHLYLVIYYSDIEFTDEELADAGALYDTLESSGFMNKFIAAMNIDEYNTLYDTLNEIKQDRLAHGNSFTVAANELMTTAIDKGKEAIQIMKEFNPELYEQVMNFAKAANGDREIEAKGQN